MSLEARRRVNDERGAVGIRIYLRATELGRDAIVLPEGVPGRPAGIAASSARPSAPLDGGGRLRVAVDASEENIRYYWERGRDITGVSG